MNALGKTMVMRHPVDRKVFHGIQVKLVHNTAAVLMEKSPRRHVVRS